MEEVNDKDRTHEPVSVKLEFGVRMSGPGENERR
jgi:hypothetical protein